LFVFVKLKLVFSFQSKKKKSKLHLFHLQLRQFRKSLHKVRDIWGCEKNNFKDSNFIFNTLIDKRNWISQWTRLKGAITGDLKNILNENENNLSPSNQNLKSFKLQESKKKKSKLHLFHLQLRQFRKS
jgi:hypothetical protein